MGKHSKVEAREQDFAAYIKNHPNEIITANAVAKRYGIGRSTAYNLWAHVTEYIGGTLERQKGIGVMWIPPVIEAKNHEGYGDPTASKAIANADPVRKKSKDDAINPGDVYVHTASGGQTSYVYVVASFDHHNISLPIYKEGTWPNPGDYAYPITIPGSADSYYVDISRVGQRQNKYMTDKVGSLESEVLFDIRRELAGIFGFESASDEQKAELIEKYKANFVHEKQEREAERSVALEANRKLLMENSELVKQYEEEHELTGDLAAQVEDQASLIKELEDDLRITKDRAKFECDRANKLDEEKHRFLDQINNQASIIKDLEDKNACLNLSAPISDKRMEIELKVLQAKLDIYEKELFGKEDE